MRNWLNVPLICVALLSAGVSLHAESSQASVSMLNAAGARNLTLHAVNSEDHLRLAAYYLARADKTKLNLAEAESLMRHWASVPGMADRSKVPNPYTTAKTLVEIYRTQMEKEMYIADEQRRMADSSTTSVAKAQ